MKKEKEMHASFAVVPQTVEVMTTVCDKSLVKMEKAFNSWAKDMNREHSDSWERAVPGSMSQHEDFSKGSPETRDCIHISFMTVYCLIVLFYY